MLIGFLKVRPLTGDAHGGKATRQRRAREKRERKKMQEASRKLDALAKRLGRWDAQAIIRKFRDTNLKGDA